MTEKHAYVSNLRENVLKIFLSVFKTGSNERRNTRFCFGALQALTVKLNMRAVAGNSNIIYRKQVKHLHFLRHVKEIFTAITKRDEVLFVIHVFQLKP